ncbi:25730_t:CDS:1, partial [Gigaspora rosea]
KRVLESKEQSKVPFPKATTSNNKEQNSKMTGETSEGLKKSKKYHFWNSYKNKNSETLEQKNVVRFKKLENTVLGFDDRLNLVSAQIQDTCYRVEINDTWPNYKFERFCEQHKYNILC